MIDYTEPRRALEMYVNTNFSAVPVIFENVAVDESVDLSGGFIDFTDLGGSNVKMDISGDESQVKGNIVIRIYTPLGSGTQQGRQIASTLDTLLKGQTLSGLHLMEPVFESFGQVEGADFFQQNLTFPYQFFYGQTESDC